MDNKIKFYKDLIIIVSDIYKLNEKNMEKTYKELMRMNENKNLLKEELINLLKFINKLDKLYYKKLQNLNEYIGDIYIKTAIDNDECLNNIINIYKNTFIDNYIDFDLLLFIIIPTIIIKINNYFEIIDFNAEYGINTKNLKFIKNLDINNECCSICLEKFNKDNIIMTKCCCNLNCIKCFNLNSQKCAICKGDNLLILKIL